METKLWNGNLSHDTTGDDLQKIFARAGTVILVDKINFIWLLGGIK